MKAGAEPWYVYVDISYKHATKHVFEKISMTLRHAQSPVHAYLRVDLYVRLNDSTKRCATKRVYSVV